MKRDLALRNSALQMRRISDIFLCICVPQGQTLCIFSGAFYITKKPVVPIG